MRAWFKQHFTSLDRSVDRFGYWQTFFAFLSGVMSWAASSISSLSQYGWGAVVFVGIIGGSFVMFLIAGALGIWRYFHPLPQQQAAKAASDGGLPHLEAAHFSRNDKGITFVGVPARVIGEAQMLLEYEQVNSDHQWIRRRPILLGRAVNVRPGLFASVQAPVLSEQFIGGNYTWYWGPLSGQPDRNRIYSDGMFRGCVRFVPKDGQEQRYFFHSHVPDFDRRIAPRIIAEDIFDFSKNWDDAPSALAVEDFAAEEITHDVWLQKAITRAFSGSWLPLDFTEWQKLKSPDKSERLHQLVEGEFRQRAYDGSLPIWGQRSSQLWEPIDREFWLDHCVNYLTVIDDDPSKLTIQNIKTGESLSFPLKTSQLLVDRIWPAHDDRSA